MAIYDFIAHNLALANVKNIIKTAGFDSSEFSYQARLDNDGYKVTGPVMATSKLENAAKKLNLHVEIHSAAHALQKTDDLGTQYCVEFTMDSATVAALAGSSLVVFKGVSLGSSTSVAGAAPVAWVATTEFGPTTTLTWAEDYSAYISQSTIVPNGIIQAANMQPITLGEVLEVDAQMNGTVQEGGEAGCISISNTSSNPYTCGLAVGANGQQPQPICAFPLYGTHVDVFIPEERIYLMFVGATINSGVVYEQSVGSGLLVDLTGAQNRAGISYDINAGWAWNNAPWATQYAPATNLAPLLLDNSTQFKVKNPRRLALAA